MSAIYEKVKDMNRTEKMAYFKTITPEEKKAYNNFLTYQRVLKQRNNDRAKYNEYMKGIKNKARKANPQLYRIQNNKDVANYRASANDAAKVITNNLKIYIQKLKAIKQVNEDVAYKQLLANVKSHTIVDNMFDNILSQIPNKRGRGRPPKK